MVFPEENSGDLLIPKKMVLISEMDMVAKGNDRAVFFHPRYPDILLKLLLDFSQINLVGFRGWSLKTFPSTRGRAIFKEYEATISTHFNVQEKLGELPISRLYGFVETDQGQKVYPKAILKEPEKYFNDKVMMIIEKHVNDKFSYGVVDDRTDDTEQPDSE